MGWGHYRGNGYAANAAANYRRSIQIAKAKGTFTRLHLLTGRELAARIEQETGEHVNYGWGTKKQTLVNKLQRALDAKKMLREQQTREAREQKEREKALKAQERAAVQATKEAAKKARAEERELKRLEKEKAAAAKAEAKAAKAEAKAAKAAAGGPAKVRKPRAPKAKAQAEAKVEAEAADLSIEVTPVKQIDADIDAPLAGKKRDAVEFSSAENEVSSVASDLLHEAKKMTTESA